MYTDCSIILLYTVKTKVVEPTNLSPSAHQIGNWCVGGNNLAGSAHLCFYNVGLKGNICVHIHTLSLGMHPVHKAARDATGNREYIGKALVCNCGHLTRL